MESLLKAMLESGPPFWLALASILLNVVLLTALGRITSARQAETKEMTAALTLSTRAIEAASEDREETIALIRENHHATMLAFAKQESALAAARSKRASS